MLEIFKNSDFLHISNFIETKLPKLREIEKYNKIYLENTNLIDELEKIINDNEKNKFDKLIKSFYELDEYYFAYAFLLGIKFGKELEKL